MNRSNARLSSDSVRCSVRGVWLRAAVLAAVCGAVGSAAFAQAQDDVLKGPAVREATPPGPPRTLDGQPRRERYLGAGIPQRRYMEILRETLGESADASLRLSEEQMNDIRAAEREFRETQRAYGEKMREQYGIEPPGERGGGERGRGPRERRPDGAAPAPADDMMGPEGRGEGRPPRGREGRGREDGDRMAPEGAPDQPGRNRDEIMREIRANAPKPSELQAKIWAGLTMQQQAALKPKLDAETERMATEGARKSADRERDRLKAEFEARRAKRGEGDPEQGKGKSPKEGAEGRPGRGGDNFERIVERLDAMTPEQRDRLRERLANMPAEQRERLMQRMRDRGINPDTLEMTPR